MIRINTKSAGWIVHDGSEKGVRVAPWVVKKQKGRSIAV